MIIEKETKETRSMLFLTQQSSCKQHQATAAVADSSYSQKDTDLCSSQSNIMYLVQAYTLQTPAVKIGSLALTRENIILLEMLMEEGTGSRDYDSRDSC